MDVEKVIFTEAALEVVAELKDIHGDLLFHQSGGCCDGSAPMCYPRDEFRTGDSDVKLGEIAGCPFYIARDQYEYWKHTQLIIDITKGRGSSFSLEIPMGLRFMVKSRVFNNEELAALGLINAPEA